MKISLVHDYLREYGGAEKVLESLSDIWPSADIFTSNYEEEKMGRVGLNIPSGMVHTTFVQYLPFRYKLRKHYFLAYPLAFKIIKINSDVILSSCSYASKFVRKPKNSLHICYLHSVPKFLWGYETETPHLQVLGVDKYLQPIYKKTLPAINNFLRKLDFNAAQRVDLFIANSNLTRDRIKKHYRRDSEVIYPPVDLKRFEGKAADRGYFLIISRLSSFKRIDVAIKAFNKLKWPLKIIGDGQELSNLKKISNSNIEFLGTVSDKEFLRVLKNCTAVVFPTLEDFGIVPVEAMAAGKPVISYRGGGALETVVEGVTGEFFDEQTSESLINKLKKFDPSRYNADDCRKRAKKFSKEEFKRKIKTFVDEAWSRNRNSKK